jgi:hypothetical protein
MMIVRNRVNPPDAREFRIPRLVWSAVLAAADETNKHLFDTSRHSASLLDQ